MSKLPLGWLFAVAVAAGFASVPAHAADSNVLMYATKTCGYCAKARAYLTQRGVTWEERDIEASAQAAREWKALGGVGTPVIVIGGESIVGFQPQRIDAALAKHGTAH